jgi:hypothetical protein
MAEYEKDEYKFPDEIEAKNSRDDDDDDDFTVVIEDDTPVADRNKEPLPKDLKSFLHSSNWNHNRYCRLQFAFRFHIKKNSNSFTTKERIPPLLQLRPVNPNISIPII